MPQHNITSHNMKLFIFTLAMLLFFSSSAQQPYVQGNVVADFDAPKILNSTQKAGSFASLKSRVTIIDFFGTWCTPCVKALPRLDSIQKKFNGQISIILVSVEKEQQLNKFISGRKNFNFPVLVDEESRITSLFEPPAYPYTVVINGSGKIVAITEAAAITDEKLHEWLTQKIILPDTGNQKIKTMQQQKTSRTFSESKNPFARLSAAFIYAAKTGNETQELENELMQLNFDSLAKGLKTDDEKKAFWINIYNGYTQLLLKKDAGKYKDRSSFFKARQIPVAGTQFSLDEIEHDILRRSKIKWSLGYFSKLFPGKKARALRVNLLDYRIHFALNCGAKSCPPIAFYNPGNLQQQLETATRAYLTGEAVYDREKNLLQLPAIMGWFRRDFKGKKNMLKLTKIYGIVPQQEKPQIVFKKYDWNLYLNNYSNE